jgi:hypothetical protein
MKRVIKTFLLCATLCNLFSCSKSQEPVLDIPQIIEEAPPVCCNDTVTEWQIFILALIEVESGNNPMAAGKVNAGGIFQITPVYIEEVNRIQSKNIFTPEDRFDIRKSFDMFNAMNGFYNKSRDIEKAVRLHNPNAPASYRAKIMKKIAEIKKREAVRKQCVKLVIE